MLAEFGEVGLLIGPTRLEATDEIPEQVQSIVVLLLDEFDGCGDVLRSESTLLGGFKRDHNRVGSTKRRVAHQR